MNQYRITAMTGRTVNYIRIRADGVETAIEKAIRIWKEVNVLSEAEIEFTKIKCEEV